MSKKSDPVLFRELADLYLSPTADKSSLISLLDKQKNRLLLDSLQEDKQLLSHLSFDRKTILKLYNRLK